MHAENLKTLHVQLTISWVFGMFQSATFVTMFRKAIAIFLAFFIMWGNTGFSMNVHYCETSESVSLMVNNIIGEKCSTDEVHNDEKSCEVETVKSCCKKLAQTLPSAKKSCCSNMEVQLKINDAFQLSSQQIQIQKQLSTVIFIPFTDYFSHYTSIPSIAFCGDIQLPDIPGEVLQTGQSTIIQHCTYRI